MRQLKLFVAAVAAAAGMAMPASSVRAQDIQWAAPVNGNWNDPANWNPANIPDQGNENAVLSVAGTYTVSLNIGASIGALNITRKNATLAILDGMPLYLHANSLNNGKILVNSNGGQNNSVLRFDGGDYALAGTGLVVLAIGSDDLNDARLDTYGATLTQGSGHTIRGTGNIGAAFINNGTVVADVNQKTLQLIDNAKTNNAVMKALAGGNLQLYGSSLAQGAQGVLLADAGQATLINTTVAGGTLDSANGGQVRVFGGVNLDANIVNQHVLNISDGSAAYVHNGLTNNGVITINEGAGQNNSALRFDSGDLALGGAGQVVLVIGSGDLNDARLDTYGATVTQGAGHTIRGTGNIGASLINNGTVIADVDQQTLQLVDNPKTNNALMKALTGSNLQLNGPTLTQGPQGVMLADGGQVTLVNCAVVGGMLDSANGGQVRAYGSVVLNGIVDNEGALNINDSAGVYIHDGLTNNGVITINEGGGQNNSTLRFDSGDLALGGTGEVRMVIGSDDLNDARLDTYGATVTINTHMIHGAGNIGASLVNNGFIVADIDQKTLQLVDNPKTNNLMMKALNGAYLQLNGTTVTQNAPGVMLGDGGQVALVNCTVAGGSLDSANGGQVRAYGSVTLNGAVANLGAFNISDGAGVYVHDGLINNGTIAINPDAGQNNSFLRFDGGDLHLDGSGQVLLRLGSADFNDAILGTYGASLTLGPDQSLRGNGRLSGGPFTIQGVIAPGESVGQIDVQGIFALASTARYNAQVAATNSYDQITVNGTATLGGTLNITLLNGFVPDTCFVVPLVTASSIQGAFDSVAGDPGNGRVWRVAYTSTQALAYVTCYADMAVDCKLDLFDFLAFTNYFNAQDPIADCTGDGVFDLFDFLCFVNAFNKGC